LIRLYQEAIVREGEIKPSHVWHVLPLILSESLIREVCGVDVNDLCDNYSGFMIDYLGKRGVNVDSRTISNRQLLPLYPITKRINGEWKGLLYCYNYNSEREVIETEIMTPTRDCGLNLNNQELYQIFRGLDRNKSFTIQICLNGHSRPNFFLGYDKDRFICLQNTGKGALKHMGVFNERVAYDIDNSLIFSTVPVETGSYRVTNSGGQRLELDLQGVSYNMRLNLSFGKVISFSSKISDSKGVQKTLADP